MLGRYDDGLDCVLLSGTRDSCSLQASRSVRIAGRVGPRQYLLVLTVVLTRVREQSWEQAANRPNLPLQYASKQVLMLLLHWGLFFCNFLGVSGSSHF